MYKVMSTAGVAHLATRLNRSLQGRRLPSAAQRAQWFAWALAGLLFAAFQNLAAGEAPEDKVRVQVLRFGQGSSRTVVSGAVIRGERVLYALNAGAGQRMWLSVSSKENNAAFQVYRPGATVERRDYGVHVEGRALVGAGEGQDARRWIGVLPEAGAYLVVLGPTWGNATYRLSVTIR